MAPSFVIIRWSGMGDVVMALPAVRLLKENFPGCRTTFLTDLPFAPLVELSGLVDRVIPLDRRGFETPGRRLSGVRSLFAALAALSAAKPDVAFDLQGFGETAVLARVSGAPVRVGRIKNSGLRKRIYNRAITADWEQDHRALYFSRVIAKSLGLAEPVAPEPPVLPSRFPDRSGLSVAGLNLGASTENRRWSLAHFLDLGKKLEKEGLSVRVFCGPQEAHILPEVQAFCKDRGWDLVLSPSTVRMVRGIDECRVLVSNDTGPGHVAAALGVPVATIFSTGDPDNVRPLAPATAWFRDKEDINRIRVEPVFEACMRLVG
ncbi:MAG: glycosyltransferase family 9 protein [Proteobacteria bacterium]|nr:glycosyltransferase family 9 protein [Pseudomonadota bacterium]